MPSWENDRVPQNLGVYVSIPFCRGKCTFCNFASDAFHPGRMQGYVDRVVREMAAAAETAATLRCTLPDAADTLYLGGGTPSLLEPEQLARLLSVLRHSFAVTGDAEITMEAAPGQIGGPLLEAALAAGVNRVSLGVQSFVDAEARAVGRLHTGAMCLEEIERLRRAGVPRLSVDLIAGLPHQTGESWAASLRSVVDSDVEHVSVYMLETDGESRLGTEVERVRAESQLAVLGQAARYHAAAVPSDEQCAALYQQACETLCSAGFQQYEISNFARGGAISRHNHKYWDRAPYLGLGMDAHSLLFRPDGVAVRFQNADELDVYEAAAMPAHSQEMTAREAFEEAVFLGLRRTGGLTLAELRAFGQDDLLRAMLQRTGDMQAAGLLHAGERLTLTPAGRVLSSAVFGELLTAA